MVKLLNNYYLGASTPDDYGTFKGVVELLHEYYLGAAVPSGKPSYIDVILSGVSYVTLLNAVADGLNYVKLFGATENVPETYLDTVTLSGGCTQASTPTPSNPVPIVCNNGELKVSPNLTNYNNTSDWVDGYYANNGETRSASDINKEKRSTYYIPVTGGSSYTFSCRYSEATSSTTWIGVCYYDSNKDLISRSVKQGNSGETSSSATYTLSADAAFVRICFRTFGTAYDVQFEKGDTATVYRPYAQVYTSGTKEVVTDNASNTATATDLLGIGTYLDTQEVLSGAVTRNVGILILDGTEDWVAYPSGNGYWLTIEDMLVSKRGNYYCSHAVHISDNSDSGIMFGSGAGNNKIYW